ncbi:MAG: hypothetical protein ABIY50_13875 [Ignavibacteria bacterium]
MLCAREMSSAVGGWSNTNGGGKNINYEAMRTDKNNDFIIDN